MIKLFLFLISMNLVFADTNFTDPILRPPQSTTQGLPSCPSPYGCFGYDVDINKFVGFNGTGWVSFGSGLEYWSSGTNYVVGDVVIMEVDIYSCISAHISTDFSLDITKWKQISSTDNGTALLSGGDPAFTVGGKILSVTGGNGIIVDVFSVAGDRTFRKIEFDPVNLTLNIPANQSFWVAVDESTTPAKPAAYLGRPILTDIQNRIILGRGNVDDNGDIQRYVKIAWTPELLTPKLQAWMEAIGVLYLRSTVTPISQSLSLLKTAGLIQGLGINPSSRRFSDTTAFISQNPMPFYYATSDNLDYNSVGLTYTYNPNIYEPGGLGTITAVPSGKFTIQKFFSFINGFDTIQLGQNLYDTLDEAIGAVNSERYILNPVLAEFSMYVYHAWAIVQEGTTNLADPAMAYINSCARFGCTGGGSSAASPLNGDVFGPASSAVDNVAAFADATGKNIKDSGISYTSIVLNAGTATNDAIPRFDGATGKIVQNSGVSINDVGDLALSNTGKVTMGSGVGDKINLFGTDYGFGISSNTLNYYTPGSHVFRTGGNNDTGTARMTVSTTGVTVANALGVTGATTLSSTLGVTGAATLNSTLGVTGATNFTGTASTTASFNVNKNVGVTPNTGGLFLNDTGNAVGRYTPGVHFGNGGVYHSKLVVRQDDANGDDNGALEFWSNAGGFSNRMTFNINYNEAWFYNIVSAVSYATRSDRRLKEDIKDLDLSKDFISKVRPVTFKWKDRDDKSLKVGLIAQEVKEILPSAVGEDEEGNLTIDYGQVIVALIKALQDSNKRIKELEDGR